jgi:hypothetical protein
VNANKHYAAEEVFAPSIPVAIVLRGQLHYPLHRLGREEPQLQLWTRESKKGKAWVVSLVLCYYGRTIWGNLKGSSYTYLLFQMMVGAGVVNRKEI